MQKVKSIFKIIVAMPLPFYGKWFLLCLITGLGAGMLATIFMVMLNWATATRLHNDWLLYLLPIAGFGIGWAYDKFGKNIKKGNAVLMEEVQHPNAIIPVKMIPFILLSTVATHFFGGSAGREGTALQLGGAWSHQLQRWFSLSKNEKTILLKCGIGAGFAAIFGTPFAGAAFALEIFYKKKISFWALLPVLVSAFLAHHFAMFFGIHHTEYTMMHFPAITFSNVMWVMLSGVFFGLAALIFIFLLNKIENTSKLIVYEPLGPVIGGVIVVLLTFLVGNNDYLGLGLPMISKSFSQALPLSTFALKIVFTAVTIGFGFKGGEVTPLFFIGATLGSALSGWMPLPVDILAGLGLVAVFAGAAGAPIACSIMGLELFGLQNGVYIILACCIANLFSGKRSIYKKY